MTLTREHRPATHMPADTRTVAGDPAPARPRLLYVVNEAGYFLSHRNAVARAACQAGWDVHVAVPDSPRCEEIEALGAQVHRVAMSRAGLHPLDNLRSLHALYVLCRRLRPELVHLVALKSVVLGAAAARLAGRRKRVLAIAGLGDTFSGSGGRGLMLRLGLRALLPWLAGREGRVIVQNEADLEQVGVTPALARRTLLITGSGVDLEAFRPQPEPEGPITVVLPARMIWKKGVGEFVEAARILQARGRTLRLQLAGDSDPGNPRAVPPETLRSWHDEGVVEWLGHQPGMAEVLAAAHIVCLPSYYGEGVPKSLLEAAAAGRPVITTDLPGCRAAIQADESGLLVPPRDPRAVADAIDRLAGDAGMRRRMGAAGRRLAEDRFALSTVVERHLALYREMHG